MLQGVQRKVGVLLIVAIVTTLFFARLFAMYIDDPGYFAKADFAVFYTAAQFTVHSQPLNSPAFQEAVTSNRGAEGSVRFLYPPAAIVIFLPLLVFSFSTAMWVWLSFSLLSIAGILFGVAILADILKKDRHRYWIYAITAALLFTPFFISVRTGQVNILLTMLFVAHAILQKKRYTFISAIPLALMITLKVFPVVLLIPYVVRRQWSLVATTIIAAGVFLVVPAVTLPQQGVENIFGRSLRQVEQGIHKNGLARYDNPTFNGVLYRFVLMREVGFFSIHDTESLQKVDKKLQNALESSEIILKDKKTRWIPTVHLCVVVPSFLALLYITYRYRKTEETFVLLSTWIGFVLFAAKDAHSEYAVLLFPVILYLLYTSAIDTRNDNRRFTAKRQLAALLGIFALFCLAWFKPLPFVELPGIILWIPLACIALASLIVFCVAFISQKHNRESIV